MDERKENLLRRTEVCSSSAWEGARRASLSSASSWKSFVLLSKPVFCRATYQLSNINNSASDFFLKPSQVSKRDVMGPSVATPAEHIHLISQSTVHSCPEKCYYKWHKSQIEDFVHKKHESWGKKMEEKTSRPLLWPKDPDFQALAFSFWCQTKRTKKRGELFPIEVYSQMKTCTTINTADEEMTQAGIIAGIQRAMSYSTAICRALVTGSWERYVDPNHPCF